MKKLLASLMALSMVFAVTGCSESNDSENESKAEAKTTTTTTTAAPAVESKADTTTTTAAPEESAADTTTSANDTDTTSTGDEAKGTYKDNVYTSDLYTFKIDSKKWAMQESAGVDVMFTYADAGDDAELESASINVISMSNDLLNGLTASDYADQIKQTYNSMDGYTVTNDKEDKFAGKDAYIVDVTGEIGSQKVFGSQQEQFATIRALYTFQFTHPGKKLNFMGNELGEYLEWRDEKELGWNLLTYPIHDSLHEYVKALHKLYLEQPALYKSDYNSTSFRWIDADNKNQCIYAYRRSDPSGKTLYMVFNFSGSYQNYNLKVEQNGAYKELLNSDRDIYSGSNCINSGLYTTNYKLPLRLAPLSSVIITTE